MSRLQKRFSALSESRRKALIPYITAGDPDPETTLELMHAIADAGADIIELGVPFSDPMADGPVIQAACERALEHDITLADVLKIVSRFHEQDKQTPVVLMGYLNPIECYGYEAIAADAAGVGVDGLLIVDMPPEEADGLVGQLAAKSIDTIFLAAPTSTSERLKVIGSAGSGFLYYVSLKGVTGSSKLDVGQLDQQLERVREHTQLPLAVGFGIATAEDAASVAQIADAVVVGSALVRYIEQSPDDRLAIIDNMVALLRSMREAMDKS